MMTTDEFVVRAKAKHGDRFAYDVTRYDGFKQPVEVRCRDHGTCQTTPKAHLHTKTGGCLKCLSRIKGEFARQTAEEFVVRAREVHGDTFNYDQITYRGVNSKVKIICPKHGAFRMTPGRHLAGRGCRKCNAERHGSERQLSFWEFVERVLSTHGPYRYEYCLEGHVNQYSKIPIRCPIHGLFFQTVAAHIRGHGCYRCAQSTGEQRVREALVSLDVEFCEQARFPECCDKRALPFDFFVPKHRLLIEFDGSQHFEATNHWGGEEKLAETKLHDAIKNRFAEQHLYHLVRIPYWDFDDTEEIVLNAVASTETFV